MIATDGFTEPRHRMQFSIQNLKSKMVLVLGATGNFGAYADWEGGEQLLRRAVELGVKKCKTVY